MKHLKSFFKMIMQVVELATNYTELLILKIPKRGIAIISLIVIVGISTIMLSGCIPRVKATTIITDTTLVESVNHTPLRTTTTFISTGKSMTPVVNTIPEKNLIVFRYKDNTIKVDSSSIYNYVKDKVGKEVVCELKITDFDNNTQSIKIEKVIKAN